MIPHKGPQRLQSSRRGLASPGVPCSRPGGRGRTPSCAPRCRRALPMAGDSGTPPGSPQLPAGQGKTSDLTATPSPRFEKQLPRHQVAKRADQSTKRQMSCPLGPKQPRVWSHPGPARAGTGRQRRRDALLSELAVNAGAAVLGPGAGRPCPGELYGLGLWSSTTVRGPLREKP